MYIVSLETIQSLYILIACYYNTIMATVYNDRRNYYRLEILWNIETSKDRIFIKRFWNVKKHHDEEAIF